MASLVYRASSGTTIAVTQRNFVSKKPIIIIIIIMMMMMMIDAQ